MNTTIEGFHTQRCSDVRRDGMYLELVDTSSGDEVAEVFYSDQTKKMRVSLFATELPLEAVEFLIQKAKAELPERIKNEN